MRGAWLGIVSRVQASLTLASFPPAAAAALACLTLALGLASFGQAGFVSNIQDVGGRAAGRLFGVANTAGCLAGIAGTTAAGFILQRGTWDALFQLQIALYLVGAVVYLAFARAEVEF